MLVSTTNTRTCMYIHTQNCVPLSLNQVLKYELEIVYQFACIKRKHSVKGKIKKMSGITW